MFHLYVHSIPIIIMCDDICPKFLSFSEELLYICYLFSANYLTQYSVLPNHSQSFD